MQRHCIKRGTSSAVALAFLLLLATGNTPLAHAATTRTVTKLADTNGTCTPTDCSLREAIAASSAGDTVDFASGLTGTILLNSVLTIGKNLTITGPGAALLAIDGRNSTRVFDITGGIVSITGVTIQHGSALQGGGMHVAATNLTLRRSAIISNSATAIGSGYGGGILAESTTTLLLTDMTIRDNTAVVSGGGIYGYGSLKLFRSTVSGNSTTSNLGGPGGGGLYNAGQAQLTNVTFSGNTSADHGGGIRNYGTAWLTNVTITGNTAPNGSGIDASEGAMTLKNTIVSSSSSDNCHIWGTGTIADGGNNIDSGTSCGFDANLGSKSSTNPGLAALADNGGPVRTHALLAGSAALNAGSATTCAADAVSPSWGAGGTDARGLPRRSGYCDIGAFEAQPASLTVVSGSSPQSTLVNTAFALPLKANVKDASMNPLGGVVVAFSAPTTGASATLSGSSATSNANGNAGVTATANGIGGGPYNVTAAVDGVAPVNFELTNNPYPTTTAITSHLPNSSPPNQPVTVAFTVTSPNGTPTGNVTVGDGTVHCTATVAAGSCVLNFTSPGNKTLTATYAGDSNFGPSASPGVTHSVTDWLLYLPLVIR